MDHHANTAPTFGDPGILAIGAVVAERYRVLRMIGKGGMGQIYEVLDERTDRLRALKVMRPDLALDAAMAERFASEVTIAGRVESPHIVEVFDAGTLQPGGVPFLVMELLRGQDLSSALAEQGPAPGALALEWLRQAATALDRLHEESIVHRDLKPDNLFLCKRDDGVAFVKILDFGIAKSLALDETLRTTRNLGTPLYMAPEQMRGEPVIDHRADLYALAQLTFTMLTGQAYWADEIAGASNPYPLLMRANQGLPEPGTARARRHGVELPKGFDSWFERATAVDVTKRYDNALTQVAALSDALGVRLELSPSAVHDARPSKPGAIDGGNGRPLTVILTMAACVVVIALGVFAFRANRPPPIVPQVPSITPQHQGEATPPTVPATGVSVVERTSVAVKSAAVTAAPPPSHSSTQPSSNRKDLPSTQGKTPTTKRDPLDDP